jgi:hypothetical protein
MKKIICEGLTQTMHQLGEIYDYVLVIPVSLDIVKMRF